MALGCFLEAVDHQTPKYWVGRWPEDWTVGWAQVLVFRQEMPRAGVEATRGAINDSGDSISETPAPRQRVCAHLKCLWFCSSLSTNSLG